MLGGFHHHGTDGSCHPGPGGLIRCEICEAELDAAIEAEEIEAEEAAGPAPDSWLDDPAAGYPNLRQGPAIRPLTDREAAVLRARGEP
jgi:hypothetical protein